MHRVSDEVSDVRWPPDLAHAVDLPPDCSAGDLAEVLEFLKVSGITKINQQLLYRHRRSACTKMTSQES